MAIDPKLVSIIPASQLPTGDPTNAADFLFYEGNELKKSAWSNITALIESGSTQVQITQSAILPTEGNIWGFANAGTYANAGGLVVAAGNLGVMSRVGGVWSKTEIPMPTPDIPNQLSNVEVLGVENPLTGTAIGNNTWFLTDITETKRVLEGGYVHLLNNGTLWIKRFELSPSGLEYIYKEQRVITPLVQGFNAFTLAEKIVFNESDILGIYSSGGLVYTNIGKWTTIKYPSTASNLTSNVAVANTLTLNTNASIQIGLIFNTGDLINNYLAPIASGNEFNALRGTEGKILADRDIMPFAAKEYTLGSKVFYKKQIWESVSNTLSTDIPSISDKWVLALEFIKPINPPTLLARKNVILNGTISIDENDDAYIVDFDGSNIIIFKNNVRLSTFPFVLINASLSSSYVKDGVIHMLIAASNGASATNGLRYITYNLTTRVLTPATAGVSSPDVLTNENAALKSSRIVEFNGSLYVCVETIGIYVGTSLDSSASRKRLDLFKLNSGSWSKVSTIAIPNEVWGAKFTNYIGVTSSTIAANLQPQDASLFVAKGELYCVFTSSAPGPDYRKIFIKKSTDGITWVNHKIEGFARGNSTFGYEDKYGNINLITRRYLDGTYSYNGDVGIHVFNIGGNSFFDTKLGSASFTAYHKNEKLHIVFRVPDGSSFALKHIAFTDKEVNDSINPISKNKIGRATLSTLPVTGLDVGDYYEASDAGEYINFKSHTIPYQSSFESINIKVTLGESVRLVWNGFSWFKEVISSKNLDTNKSIAFRVDPQFNSFMAKGFRIPVVTITESNELLALADARYTTGSDYDEIDLVMKKSLNTGSDWIGDKIVFKRPLGMGLRIHDAGVVVDRFLGSTQYGRIWAFAKLWNYNFSPSETAFWVANKDKSLFYTCYSDDNGASWSTPVSRPNFYLPNTWHASSGASAGITLNNGTLIQPMYWMEDEGLNKAGFVYKNPNGEWTVGDIITDGVFTNENQIIQDLDGKLIMNARSNDGMRKVFSLDYVGAGWVRRTDLEVLQDVNGGCSASFIRYKNTYLFSSPTSYGSTDRRDISVFYSYDKVKWERLINVSGNIDTWGYSSLVANDSYFGIMHEDLKARPQLLYNDLNYLRNILR